MIIPIVVGMMSTNAYIAAEENGSCYIIDPGGDADTIIDQITRKSLRPRGIILTHGHLDHVGAVGPIMARYGEEGDPLFLAIHEADSQYTGETAREAHEKSFASMGMMGGGYFQMLFSPLPKADVILKEGEQVDNSRFEVIHTPGHTEGSVCLLDRQEKTLISGDTLFNRGVGRTDLPGGDFDTLMNSLTEKLMILDDDIRVYPGHGPETTIGDERRKNPFIGR